MSRAGSANRVITIVVNGPHHLQRIIHGAIVAAKVAATAGNVEVSRFHDAPRSEQQEEWSC
jgi:hypothetical protein